MNDRELYGIGIVLRLLRRGHGLPQADLAEALGIDNSYVARIETGRRPSPRVLSRWIERCPLPARSVEALAADLHGLYHDSEEPMSASRQMVVAALLSTDLPPASVIAGVLALRFPASAELAATPWSEGSSDSTAAIWLVLRAAGDASREMMDMFHTAGSKLDWIKVASAWSRLVAVVNSFPVVSYPAEPEGPDWSRVTAAWPALSPVDRHLLAEMAERLRSTHK
jgi:DNA-binding XRE family transcriptional regulator